MRKVIKGITASLVLLPVLASSSQQVHAATAEKIIPTTHPIIVTYNARQMDLLGAKADLKGGSVYVPLRGVAQAMGASVQYSDGKVTLSKEANSVELKAGSKIATINGNDINFAQPMYSQNGRTMVPLRLIAEAFEEKVEWDGELDYVWIGNKEVPDIETIIKPKSIDPIKVYFKGYERLLTSYVDGRMVNLDEMMLFSKRDFPLKVNGITYYRINIVKSNKNNAYLRSISNVPNSGVSYLVGNGDVRLRSDVKPFRVKDSSYTIQYIPIASRQDYSKGFTDWGKFSYEDIDYIQIRRDYHFALIFDLLN
ncbi:copper amine oxidase N-terminal domain-containing protein [Paenibacillus herberti]|uniref:Copper amine oxidase-like N-terminal domain-containing protein n=1 Tax=Paenibacillus herberti TaxID=1619309 RepID=A0A229NVD6_9BACL|nr:copper amine oxidase N-terminal domain-containing protein [Paenibacillus herberti]OXM13800.1 hypothetical protein CGZ75_22600 [Paenibacillus herberti]